MTISFNKKSLLLSLGVLALFSLNIHAEEKIIDATISGYECGDNCYLEIIDNDDGEMVGLCTADLCEKWNEEATMPKNFIGKKVRIVIGEAQQFDAEGNVMETMEAFTKIELLN